MSTRDIGEAASALWHTIQRLEARSAQLTSQHERTTDTMRLAVKEASQLAKQLSTTTASSFQKMAGDALRDGMRDAVREAKTQLEQSMCDVRHAASELHLGLERTQRAHRLLAWKAFLASAAGSVLVVAACAYAVMTARTTLARAEWISLVNAAIAAGNLAPCEKEGICAQVDGKRWVRIDQPQGQRK